MLSYYEIKPTYKLRQYDVIDGLTRMKLDSQINPPTSYL
ncbi:hypothetical protein BRLA_c022650 [Brevibacillus laterosporus LMG 15441]|uniref:Uncharacterized protein n=1 Tax=Brevibacillus laterosporus LMG 15441 TaxID=1042163 RepID=A0A075R531_BRELA|nr:hypothetical protein BRLA_c022650 [Brevibacillus laterosporus LMG 15441]